ncbi:hypothetical protein NQ317_004048 [Molorchus minor]|uniref:Uncharacterized protein n=1 Tax=Molorchus minor TaxID=1323400 RepID=A0ABQ9ITM9_9CUCU|nr:hypothetical protein NQ317_004048 [Molorchus minor]
MIVVLLLRFFHPRTLCIVGVIEIKKKIRQLRKSLLITNENQVAVEEKDKGKKEAKGQSRNALYCQRYRNKKKMQQQQPQQQQQQQIHSFIVGSSFMTNKTRDWTVEKDKSGNDNRIASDLATVNGFVYLPIPPDLRPLNYTAERLIAPFALKFVTLPVTGDWWSNNKLIFPLNVNNMVTSLRNSSDKTCKKDDEPCDFADENEMLHTQHESEIRTFQQDTCMVSKETYLTAEQL